MLKKEINRRKRHFKIRKRVNGTEARPRLVVKKSLKNLHLQIVDDEAGKVLYGIGTVSKRIRDVVPYGGNISAAKQLAKAAAVDLKEKGIKTITFDRAGNLYHGRIKALADTLREEGIEF